MFERNIDAGSEIRDVRVPDPAWRLLVFPLHLQARAIVALSLVVLLGLASGCKKSPQVQVAEPATNQVAATPGGPAPGPPQPSAPTPDTTIDTSSIEATLADLTHQLHRTMIGRHLSGSFEEFVAISKVNPPPPPAGKKYAISKQWKVILVNQ
jgi:hypothetical protein